MKRHRASMGRGKIKLWNLTEEKLVLFKVEVQRTQSEYEDGGIEGTWENMKETLVKAAEKRWREQREKNQRKRRHSGGMRKCKM